nr:hypothetical protein [Tanacetum cinerariifolium]
MKTENAITIRFEGLKAELSVLRMNGANDIQDTDDDDAETESDEEEIYKYRIQVHKYGDVEMKYADTVEFGNEEREMNEADNAKIETAKEDKGDDEPASKKVATTQENQETITPVTLKEMPLQSPSILTIPISVISGPKILSPIPEIPIDTPVTTTLPPPPLRVEELEKDVSTLKKIYHSAEALASFKSQVSTVIDNYLGSKLGDALQKVLQRHTADLIQQYSVKLALETSKILTPTIDLEQESKKSVLEIHKIKKEQVEAQDAQTFNRNLTNHALYHALMEALIEDENAMDKGVVDTIKHHKRQHDDDEDDDDDPSARLNQGKKTKRRRNKESEYSKKPSITKKTSKGKAPTIGAKTGKSVTTKESFKESIVEVVMDDIENTTNEEVVNDVDQPQDDAAPYINKPSRDTWFTQPSRPPTPNLE